MSADKLPETGFVRLNQILEIIPVCKSLWWAKVKSGEWPKPYKISSRVTAWRVEDIKQLIEKLSNAQ